MKILDLLDAALVLVNLEVNLGDKKQSSPTLCAKYKIGRARVGKECRSRWSPYH